MAEAIRGMIMAVEREGMAVEGIEEVLYLHLLSTGPCAKAGLPQKRHSDRVPWLSAIDQAFSAPLP